MVCKLSLEYASTFKIFWVDSYKIVLRKFFRFIGSLFNLNPGGKICTSHIFSIVLTKIQISAVPLKASTLWINNSAIYKSNNYPFPPAFIVPNNNDFNRKCILLVHCKINQIGINQRLKRWDYNITGKCHLLHYGDVAFIPLFMRARRFVDQF